MASSSTPSVTFTDGSSKVVLDNGYVKVTLSKPGGIVTAISYAGLDNLLEVRNKETNRGYWDLNWSETDAKDIFDVPGGTDFKLVYSDGDRVEVSFTRPFDSNRNPAMVPLTIDKRFVLLRGHSGFYTYAIYDHAIGWRDFNLNQTRVCFKLNRDIFHYMALADNKLRLMPSPEDMTDARSEQLAYKEARLLTNPIEPSLKGEVDDKYLYSCDNIQNQVHGWMCDDPGVGFWMITPSNEFRNGGPTKQDLTSHTGPTCLAMFHSAHYAGIELCAQFRSEAWRKVFGPVYIYLNKKPAAAKVRDLWDDAKARMQLEWRSWPYTWPASSDYPKAADRGEVSGRILFRDRVGDALRQSGKDALVGLAKSSQPGAWQKDSKGYQFWTKADVRGNYTIKNVRVGVYDVVAWIPGVLGDFRRDGRIRVGRGEKLVLSDMVYEPPRAGPTVWSIGVADRSATGYIPDPDPKYVNKLFVNHPEKWRQYGLWARYTQLYPDQDLIYTVGKSDWTKDWFFAHVPRRVVAADGSYSYKATTWQVRFRLTTFDKKSGPYTLRLGIAASNQAAIAIKVNDITSKTLFDTQQFGRDNAVARHGIHGLYVLFSVQIAAAHFKSGDNTIFLTQRKVTGPYNGVMYDSLRLEGPST
ncbi:rhamnogalacturonan endolyase [Marchantia polymorpha subsp. ruderalis]